MSNQWFETIDWTLFETFTGLACKGTFVDKTKPMVAENSFNFRYLELQVAFDFLIDDFRDFSNGSARWIGSKFFEIAVSLGILY